MHLGLVIVRPPVRSYAFTTSLAALLGMGGNEAKAEGEPPKSDANESNHPVDKSPPAKIQEEDGDEGSESDRESGSKKSRNRSISAPPVPLRRSRDSVDSPTLSGCEAKLENKRSSAVNMRQSQSSESWKDSLSSNYKFLMYLARHKYDDEKVLFVDKITKINSWGMRQKRLFAITTNAMYNLTDRFEVRRRVPLEKIRGITKSQNSNEFVVHIPTEYDYWFESTDREHVLECLTESALHITVAGSPNSKLKEYVQGKYKQDNSQLDEQLEAPPLPGLKNMCMFKKLSDKRAHTRAELVTTEQSYCRSLVQFLALFAYPLDVERNKSSIMQNRNKWVDIFDNFENIVRFHCDFFCPDLQNCVKEDSISTPVYNIHAWATGRQSPTSVKCRGSAQTSAEGSLLNPVAEDDEKTIVVGNKKTTTDIGAAFNMRVTLLKTVYEPYLANWTKLQEAVKKLQTKSKYANFMKKQREISGGLGISSYLIMPIQRVPRYVLLINELVKHTDPEHPEYASLQKALRSIQKIAKVCDSYIK